MNGLWTGSRWQRRLEDAELAAQAAARTAASERAALFAELDSLRATASLPSVGGGVVDFELPEVQSYVAAKVSDAVAAASDSLRAEISSMQDQMRLLELSKQRMEATLNEEKATVAQLQASASEKDERLSSSEGVLESLRQELEAANARAAQAEAQAQASSAAGASAGGAAVSTEAMKAIMQDIYMKAFDVFVPDGDDSVAFSGKDVTKRLKSVLKAVTSERQA